MRTGEGKLMKFVLAGLLLLFIGGLQAQEYIAHIQKLGMEDGLSSYNIKGIMQDSDGYMWISTDYGLNRYDGSSFRTYTAEENGLCGNNVLGILEDQHKMIWVVTVDPTYNLNYCVFDKNKEQFYSLEAYLGSPPPFDPKHTHPYMFGGTLLFCDDGYNADNTINYYEFDGKKINKLFSIHRDNHYIADKTQEGIFKIAENRYATFWLSRIQEEKISLTFDHKGTLTETFRCPGDFPEMLGTTWDSDNLCICCMAKKGTDWYFDFYVNWKRQQKQAVKVKSGFGETFAFHGGKIYVIGSDSLKIYNKDGFLESSVFLGLTLTADILNFPIFDRDGNIWFRNQEYLYIISLEKKRFTVELQDALNPDRLRGITHNAEGKIIVAEIGYINEQQKSGKWQPLPYTSRNHFGLLSQDSVVWLGTEGYRLCKLDARKKQMEEFFASPGKDNEVSSIIWMPFIDADGQVWAGGNKGLYRLDQVKKVLLPFDGGNTSELSKSAVYAFHQNVAGTWLCTSSGLYLVDLKQEKILGHYNSRQTGKYYLPTDHLAHLHEDKNGTFWLASKGGGLIRLNYQTGEYQQYTQKNAGLSHNVLYAVYEDDYGTLWIPSQRGLMRFQKETGAINVYLKEDGLPHNEFNTISHYQGPDGQLYFGGQNGLVHFHPKDFEVDKKGHPFLITDFSKQSFDTDSITNLTNLFLESHVITISPNDKAAVIKLAFLDYSNTQNRLYSYQIVGYDKSWNYQTRNEIRISGLPYGDFELKIRAKNVNSSTWVDYPETIIIQVLRPFYLQAWFIVLGIGLIGGGIYGLTRWRIQSLIKGKQELEKVVLERTAKIEKAKSLIEQQAAELRSLDELKTKFFANISHELRTPLTLILGPLSYILDNPDEWEKEEVRGQLQVMQRNGKSLMELIEEILDLSKLEANKLELQEEPTPVKQLMEYIYAVFEPQFKFKNIDFEFVSDVKNDNLTLLLDRKKIEKVINNFLSNAIKFTGKHGKITLKLIEKENTVQIEVVDTGKGVHPNDMPFIFERFYQSKQADQALHGGTGIGLALVSDFAKLMGGRAYAESTLGVGSHFYVEIPKKVVGTGDAYTHAHIDEKLEEDLIDEIGYNFTILVVEDNNDMRDYVCQLLRKQYSTVLSAYNGVEALQLLETYGTDIHLIVSDVMMPEKDGLSMLKEIKSNKDWMGIPVIMLTAMAAERDKLHALTIGVDDYLTKPFSVNELLIRTQNLLYNYHQRQLSNNGPAEDEVVPETEYSITDRAWIKEVEAKIKNSIKSQVFDVEGLASQLFISSRQLSRKLNAVTGLSTAKFIREVRLRAALTDLEDGTVLSITEVTFKHGFEQVSTFSKLFKKRFGKNPSEYLKGGA